MAAGTDHIAFTLRRPRRSPLHVRALEGRRHRAVLVHQPRADDLAVLQGSRRQPQSSCRSTTLPDRGRSSRWMRSGEFAANPIGVVFDPEELLARYEAGEPLETLHRGRRCPRARRRSTCCASRGRCGRRCRALRVLAADVVGYSRRCERTRPAPHRRRAAADVGDATFDPAVAARNGRVVKLSVPPCEVSCQIELSHPWASDSSPKQGKSPAVARGRASIVGASRPPSRAGRRRHSRPHPGIPCAGGLATWC